MSRTTVKAIWLGDRVEDLCEYGNAWGSGPYVWEALAQRHLGAEPFTSLRPDVLEQLWPLWKDEGVPRHQRAVLMMTFDAAYVSRAHFLLAASDIRQFMKDFPCPRLFACHWPAIAELFEGLPDIPAIGFHLTSVSEDPFGGTWNEQTDELSPPDWNKMYDIYDLYVQLHVSRPTWVGRAASGGETPPEPPLQQGGSGLPTS